MKSNPAPSVRSVGMRWRASAMVRIKGLSVSYVTGQVGGQRSSRPATIKLYLLVLGKVRRRVVKLA